MGSLTVSGITKKEEETARHNKTYYEKNKVKLNLRSKAYYYKHKKRMYVMAKDRLRSIINGWKKYFPKKLRCEVCNREVFLTGSDKSSLVCFDHRNEGRETIKVTPKVWLYNNRNTPENRLIWESCNFGILCNYCNPHLPTKNRIDWLEKALAYARKG